MYATNSGVEIDRVVGRGTQLGALRHQGLLPWARDLEFDVLESPRAWRVLQSPRFAADLLLDGSRPGRRGPEERSRCGRFRLLEGLCSVPSSSVCLQVRTK